MSRLFNATSDRITLGAAPLPTTGSIAFHFKPTWAQTDAVNHILFYIHNNSDSLFTIQKPGNNYMAAGWLTPSGNYIVFVAPGSYTLNQNAWNAIAVTWDDFANVTRLYLNGTLIGSNTSALVTFSTTGLSRVLGNARVEIASENAGGDFAEFAVYNRVLEAAEITILNAKVSPICVPRGLVNYYPLIRGLEDYVSGVTGTDSGTDVSDHPPVRHVAAPMRMAA